MSQITFSRLAIETCPCEQFKLVAASQLMLIYSNAQLNDTEKLLWLLMAQYAVNDKELSCEFSYQQLSSLLYKKCDVIHRALVRLHAMGYLQCELPYSAGEVTLEMITTLRLFTPTVPHNALLNPPRLPSDYVMLENGVYRRPAILINLLKQRDQTKV